MPPITLDLGAFVALSAVLVGGIAWLANLRERINTHEEKFADNEKAHAAMCAENAADHAEIKTDLKYIRARVDWALNGRGGKAPVADPAMD